jgi:hypothetical protein
MPICLASVSLNPTRASSGLMKTQYGTRRPRVVREVVAHDPEVVEGRMGELRAAGALAHRPDPGHRRLEPLVDRHVAARTEFDPGELEADPFRVRRAAGGHEHVGAAENPLARRRPDMELHPFPGVALDRPRLGTEDHVDAILCEDRLDRLRDIRILAGHELRPVLDHRHPAAEAAESLREFHADIATAEHDQVLGQAIEFEHLYRGQRSRGCEARDLGNGRMRAEIEKNPLGLDPPDPSSGHPHLDGVRGHEVALAEDEVEPVRCELLAMNFDHPVDHRALAPTDARHIRGHRSGPQAVGRRVMEKVSDFGAVDLILARQAGYVRAGTADQGTLDHDRSSSLPRKFPRDVFARLAAAEDVIFDLVGFRHRLLRCDLHDGSCNGRVDPGVFLSFVTEVDRSVSAHPVRCI